MMDHAAPSATTLHDRVCLAVRAVRARSPGAEFALRRAEFDAVELGGPVGSAFVHVLRRAGSTRDDERTWSEALAGTLVRAGGALEVVGEHASARALFELATELRPTCATTRLHAGRAARQAGQADAALAHYTRAQSLDVEGRIARLARIGEAMLSGSGERRLSQEIRSAVRAGDYEAAGVGLEARAILRCQAARCREAIRDLCACALRYPDPEHRSRAAERVAALLTQDNDLEGAREALLLVHEIGSPAQRKAARTKLYRLSLELGDALGAKRWKGEEAIQVSPTISRSGAGPRSVSLPVLRDWRDAVERTAGALCRDSSPGSRRPELPIAATTSARSRSTFAPPASWGLRTRLSSSSPTSTR
jgi:hypothetical protein